ncbi:MAG: beta-CASP ribonuclease aCPSF1, partial [Candidatus Dadabacteria bacterium]|nr:beta-CASP ribonuclease aCPSF1 [Candidatus Dadabacteria bacterium]
MTLEKILEEAMKEIRKVVPDNIEITSIDFEGPIIVIYTKNMDKFADNNDIVRQLAQSLRKRVSIRPDPSLLGPMGDAEKEIRDTIPQEADITDIFFDEESGEVTIEAMNPSLVIGKHGSQLNDLKKKIGWAPKVVRAPPIPSKTVSEVRSYLRSVRDERMDFLRKVGRRLLREVPSGENWVRVTSLGG